MGTEFSKDSVTDRQGLAHRGLYVPCRCPKKLKGRELGGTKQPWATPGCGIQQIHVTLVLRGGRKGDWGAGKGEKGKWTSRDRGTEK